MTNKNWSEIVSEFIENFEDFDRIDEALMAITDLLGEVPPEFEKERSDLEELKNEMLAELGVPEEVINNKGNDTEYSDLATALENKESVETLWLDGKGYREFPNEVLQLKKLQYLYLDNNQISIIPDSIGQLNNLRILSLGYNNIESLPDSIENLTVLEELQLSDNPLNALPEGIGHLVNLKVLNFERTEVDTLPESMRGLQNLEELQFFGTRIDGFPDIVYDLQNLRKLELSGTKADVVLSESIGQLAKLEEFTSNQISFVHEAIGDCISLQKFGSSYNDKLTQLPATIGKLTNLTWLHLQKCALTELPDELAHCKSLKRLDVGYNKLTKLSHIVEQLPNLESMGWSGNNFSESENAALVSLYRERNMK